MAISFGTGAIPTTCGEGLADRVLALAPDGVDAALDISGAGVIPDLIEVTGEASKVISIADFDVRPAPPIDDPGGPQHYHDSGHSGLWRVAKRGLRADLSGALGTAEVQAAEGIQENA